MGYEKKLLQAKEPLNIKDTEEKTFGCRHTNPDICSNNGLQNICAFTSDDCICKRPPRSWKNIYNNFKKKSN